MTTEILRHCRVGVIVAVATCTAASCGCTSVITSAYLREAWLDAVERSADDDAEDDAEDEPAAADDEPTGSDRRDMGSRGLPRAAAAGRDAGEPAAAPLSLDDAVAVAESQLASTGGLSSDARATLVTMLEATPAQDWPVVVEEFALVLAANRRLAAATAPAVPATPVAPVVVAAVPAAPAESPLPDASPADAASAPPTVAAAPAGVVPGGTAAASARPQGEPPVEQPPELAIANACFASRVRAWGVVDRFAADRFVPGQQVILYFELDNVMSQESGAGHTTRVDTRLALRGSDGGVLHEWTFEPLEETCLSRRRDYFARYVLALPTGLPPGPCRLDVKVEDLCSGRTAAASLPLDVVGR